MMQLRRYIGLLLVLALLVTGHSATASRFAGATTGAVILCTGMGPVRVLVDADGSPTGPSHFCPECVTHLLDLVAEREVWIGHLPRGRQAPALAPRAQHSLATGPIARARAPPLA